MANLSKADRNRIKAIVNANLLENTKYIRYREPIRA